MKKWILGLVLLISVGAMAQPANYIHDRVRKRMVGGMFDSTLHVPRFNGSPSLRTGGSTNDGAIAIDTANGVFYFYHNSSWNRANLDTSAAFITSVYRKTASDSVFYVKGGTHTFAFIDSTGGGSSLFPTTGTGTATGAVTGHLAGNPLYITSTYYPSPSSGIFYSGGSGLITLGDYAPDHNETSVSIDDANRHIRLNSDGRLLMMGTDSISLTSNSIRFRTLSDFADTTDWKAVVINNTTGEIRRATYWPGGGGGGSGITELTGQVTAGPGSGSQAATVKITATRIPFGDGSGNMTTSSKLVWNEGSFPSLVLGTTDPFIWLGAASAAYPVVGASSGRLALYAGSTFQTAVIYSYVGGSLIAEFKGNSGSYNTIDLNGLVTSNSTTVLSNTRGNFDISRTVPYAANGNNYHGFTDQTDFRLGLESFNSFGSFVKIGNNRTNMGHYASFQAVWSKDSTNEVADIYDFVSAVSTMTAGTIDSVFRFKVFEMTKTGGTVNVQYGIYIPDLSAAGTNYGAYIEDNVGIGTASPAVKLDVTGEIRASTAGTNANSVVTNSGAQTLTNKRITKRVGTTASTASLTIDADSYDMYTVTALAANITINNPSGTPTSGQTLVIRLEDNGTGRTIGYGADFRAIGVTLPTTTVAGKTIYLGCIWNSTDSKWDVVSVNEEV